MRLKSYFAGTVEAAMRLARQELGEEAMLMSSQPASPESQHLGQYEVVFAVDERLSTPVPSTTTPNPDLPGLTAEIAEMRRQFDRLAAAIYRSSIQRPDYLHPWLEPACLTLAGSEVDPDLILSLASSVGQEALASSPEQARIELIRHLSEIVTVVPEPPPREPRVVAVVGPPGTGKTTALVKLAARHAILARRPGRILAMDHIRVGAVEQLRSYAAILGLGFDACESVGSLALALADRSRGDHFFIDTPGFGTRDFDLARDLAACFASRREIETHLVLSCASKTSDLTQVVERFGIFCSSRLLMTRLDETSTFGAIVNLAAHNRLPVSYLTFGQQIPEDIEPASVSRIVDLALRGTSALPFAGTGISHGAKVTAA